MRISCIGDSIMQYNDCKTYPQTGWVQELARFFPRDTVFLNYARNGRSTKSFIDEGRFATACRNTLEGDYALIQFGHNDEKSNDPNRYTDPAPGGSFRSNLLFFVQELRKRGALPVLLTPMARRKFSEANHIEDTHGSYPEAVAAVAAQLGVPCIDMNTLTKNFLQKAGETQSRRFFMNFDAGLYDNYPEGKTDNSHLRSDGAYVFSQIAAAQIALLGESWPEYKPLADAVFSGTIDRNALDKEINDEKTMA